MTLLLPTSIQSLVGQKIIRVAVSHNRERIFFDVAGLRSEGKRARYGYTLEPGQRVVSGTNIVPMLGATLLDVYSPTSEGTATDKIVFTTNPTGSKFEFTIFVVEQGQTLEAVLYLAEDEDFLITEDGDNLQTEDDEVPAPANLSDQVIPKNIFSSKNSESEFFSIHEDDFNYG
jgi:hypothetical protein